jgi:hypothetical protein
MAQLQLSKMKSVAFEVIPNIFQPPKMRISWESALHKNSREDTKSHWIISAVFLRFADFSFLKVTMKYPYKFPVSECTIEGWLYPPRVSCLLTYIR